MNLNVTERTIEEIICIAGESGSESLDLSDKGLKELPPGIFSLTHLEQLDLRFNSLETANLSDLKQLKSILLTGNKLKELIIEDLTIAEIWIDLNDFEDLRFLAAQKKSLQFLNAGDLPKIQDWEILRNFEELKVLSLANNKLPKDFGEILKNFKNLEELDITNCGLAELPREICFLPLKELDISFNENIKLPPEFRNLCTLEEFIHCNAISLFDQPFPDAPAFRK